MSAHHLPFDAVVAGSHLRYDGVWQRPQQLLSRIAARVPVLFVEEPFAANADGSTLREFGGLHVLRPLRRDPAAAGAVDERTIAEARDWSRGGRVLVWLYTPMMLDLARGFAHADLLVYDCMDELAAFDFAPPELKAREAELLARADLVFTGGRSLYAARRELGERVKLYPSAVDFDHFASAQTSAPHPLLQHLDSPVCGYVGAIDERIDVEIVAHLAEHANVVMVGPIVKVRSEIFPRSSSLHFTGQMPYAALPALLAGFDVAIMPFARNAATANISPTKTPEYLAAGKPVVSTRIADVVADYGDVVRIADGPDDFAQAVRAAFEHPDPLTREDGVMLAKEKSWDATVASMVHDLRSLA